MNTDRRGCTTRGMPFTGPSILALMTCAQCGVVSPGVCPECGSAEKVKSWTRRVVTPQPERLSELPGTWYWPGKEIDGRPIGWADWNRPNPAMARLAPYQPGDIVYAKEAWQLPPEYDVAAWRDITPDCRAQMSVRYPTDGTIRQGGAGRPTVLWGRRRSSRFMPRWAARIWREVVEVRAERLQDITEEDAIAEGIVHEAPVQRADSTDLDAKRFWSFWSYGGVELGAHDSAKAAFLAYWDVLYEKRPERQSGTNPVVCAYRLAVSSDDHRDTETQRRAVRDDG